MKKTMWIALVLTLMLCLLPTAIFASGDAVDAEATIRDWYNDWGAILCLDVTFTEPVTDQEAGSIASGRLAYITINGVNLQDRYNKEESLEIGDCSAFNDLSCDVGVGANNNNILIYLCGGGVGILDPATANTITFAAGMQMLNGTLKNDITSVMDPSSGQWQIEETEEPTVEPTEEPGVEPTEEPGDEPGGNDQPQGTADISTIVFALAAVVGSGALIIRKKR